MNKGKYACFIVGKNVPFFEDSPSIHPPPTPLPIWTLSPSSPSFRWLYIIMKSILSNPLIRPLLWKKKYLNRRSSENIPNQVEIFFSHYQLIKEKTWVIYASSFQLFLDLISSCIALGKNKPRGLQAARKLRTHRRDQRWADKQYKKRALGTAFKSSPFGGSSHAKGIVLEKV